MLIKKIDEVVKTWKKSNKKLHLKKVFHSFTIKKKNLQKQSFEYNFLTSQNKEMDLQGAKVILFIAIKYKLTEIVLDLENKDHWGADTWIAKSNNCDDSYYLGKSVNHCRAELPKLNVNPTTVHFSYNQFTNEETEATFFMVTM